MIPQHMHSADHGRVLGTAEQPCASVFGAVIVLKSTPAADLGQERDLPSRIRSEHSFWQLRNAAVLRLITRLI